MKQIYLLIYLLKVVLALGLLFGCMMIALYGYRL